MIHHLIVIGIISAVAVTITFVIDDYRIQSHNEEVLKKVMFDCFNWGGATSGSYHGLRFMNDTHFIDNVDCTWTLNDKFGSEK